MQIVDSHCHLNFPDFDQDRCAVLQRAMAAKVKALLLISTALKQGQELKDLIQQTQETALSQQLTIPDLYYSTGVHPSDCQMIIEDLAEQLIAHADHPKMIGFGETGLDYYHPSFNKNAQHQAFEAHLKAASSVKLPVIVHTRSAEHDTVNLLKKFPTVKGVIHCFTGTKEMAQDCLELGFYISFSGIITFKNALPLQEIAHIVPLDKILIETDAPYLAPIPQRGKRNEPAFLTHTLAYIAQLRNMSLEDLANATTNNFFTLFRKAVP